MSAPFYLPGESDILFETTQGELGLYTLRASPNPMASILGLIRDQNVSNSWDLELTGIWMVSSDYSDILNTGLDAAFDPYLFREYLLESHSRETLLFHLAALNHLQADDGVVFQVLAHIKSHLSPRLFERIVEIQNPDRDEPHHLLTRTTILRAMRLVAEHSPLSEDEVLLNITQGRTSPKRPDPLVAAVLLVHATGELMIADNHLTSEEEEILGAFSSLPTRLIKVLICGGVAVRTENVGNLIGRTRLLFTKYANSVTKYSMPRAVGEFVAEALGMPIDDVLCVGFAIWAFSQRRTDLHAPMGLSVESLFANLPRDSVGRFLDLYAQTPVDFAARCSQIEGDWQVHPIQERPLLLIDDVILILDEQFLVDAFTKGIYWRVLDHARDNYDGSVLKLWTQFYGEMHEMIVEDYLEDFAPTLIGQDRKTIFHEEDLQRAFSGKAVDVGIDFASSTLIADAQSGQLTRATIETGSLLQFAIDMEKMVGKKLVQLNDTAKNLLTDPQPSLSPLTLPAPRIYPIVVPGGVFPSSPITHDYIYSKIDENAYFKDARIQTLKVLDLRDLEEAEGRCNRDSCTLVELLESWQNSSYSKHSLSDWIRMTDRAGAMPSSRSGKIVAAMDESFQVILSRFEEVKAQL